MVCGGCRTQAYFLAVDYFSFCAKELLVGQATVPQMHPLLTDQAPRIIRFLSGKWPRESTPSFPGKKLRLAREWRFSPCVRRGRGCRWRPPLLQLNSSCVAPSPASLLSTRRCHPQVFLTAVWSRSSTCPRATGERPQPCGGRRAALCGQCSLLLPRGPAHPVPPGAACTGCDTGCLQANVNLRQTRTHLLV